MVRFFYIFLFLIFLFPALSFAQDVSFEAYIDRENVSAGETFQVKLELVGAQAQTPPDISILPSDIQVLGQQQQASVTFVNGNQSQNVAWILDLVSDKEGTYKIPAIEIKTNAGELYTKPFRIYVKPASQISAATIDNSVFIDVQLEKQDPYIDEPVLYKTTVYHLGDISNAELVKPKAENAIVEQISQPKPSRQILNGVNYKVIEVEYIITPVKTGDINIEPSVLRGKIARDVVNNSPLDNLFAPFGGMGLAPMKEYIPFTVASKNTKLYVKPADASLNPWLVLYDMQIDDELGDVSFDQQNNRIIAKAGEPVSRRIRLTAYGKDGESLPDIEGLFNSPDFKIYADKAEYSKEIVLGTGPVSSRIKGTKTQTFTFIPQKTGMVTLPELTIPYWSLKDNKITKAVLPGKVITATEIGKEENKAKTYQPKLPEKKQETIPADQQEQDLETKIDNILNSPQAPNFIILVLAFVICVIMFVSFKIITQARHSKPDFDEDLINLRKETSPNKRRKITDNPEYPQDPRKIINFSKNKNNELPRTGLSGEVMAVQTHEALQQILQKFAAKHLKLSPNAGSVLIASEMAKKFGVDRQAALKYAAELDSVLYAGKQIDLEYLKNSFAGIISQAEENMNSSSNKNDDDDQLISLNP